MPNFTVIFENSESKFIENSNITILNVAEKNYDYYFSPSKRELEEIEENEDDKKFEIIIQSR